jgi:hypothetical protein
MNAPFLSQHLAEASRNFTEMMFALSVLDLPFEAGKHELKFQGARMEVIPAGAMIAFHEKSAPLTSGQPTADPDQPELLPQRRRFREENGEKFDKFVSAEFVVHTVYGCQVVVTNPTSSRQSSVLLHYRCAIPVLNGQFTKSVPID